MKREIMTNYNELKAKITAWVLEERATYSEFRADDLEFHLRITFGYDTDVAIEKARPTSILCYQAWVFDPDQQKAYSKLTKKEKRQFLYELEQGLTNFLVTTDIIHSEDNPEQLSIIHFYWRLYLEELTKKELFNGLLLMNRAKNFTRLFVYNKLDLDVEASQSSEGKGVA